MKRIVIGMTAHVDSGKTTLSEAMLYKSGEIRKPGRVDNGTAFLDTHRLEKSRGITVFAKQAIFNLPSGSFTLLDTPGHIDFSAETERAFQILDYAVLVISGIDGVQSHTETLWRLLGKYHIPVFIFVNKMDISSFSREYLLNELKHTLSDRIIDFSDTADKAEFMDSIAVCSEQLMNEFLENENISNELIKKEINNRNIFPCFFGSALKMAGIDELLEGISEYTTSPEYKDSFSAKVYKITTENNLRLTHLKVTGGTLKVRSLIKYGRKGDATEEKVNQIRIYSGAKFSAIDEAPSGTVCAVAGLTKTYAGECLGEEHGSFTPVLESVLSYRVIVPPDTDTHTVLAKLCMLEEEEPQLHVVWNEQLQEIHVQLMGEIQLEILKGLFAERFGIEIQLDKGSIAYKETIAETVEGVGHYEPLRHYAEVHLLMEPGEQGSGLVFSASCSEDKLDRNWQRLILSNLEEYTHIGVLTGSPITDMKITLIAGRAHIKHTEGGDFRQAALRAVRMGLKSAKCTLLEPFYSFRLIIPVECLGRALSDLQRMDAEFDSPETQQETAVITGTAPVAEIYGYHTDVASYSKGKGRLSCVFKGYFPCCNPEEIIERIGYDSESDINNPADSIFCSHGAGSVVKWNEVRSKMHVDSGWRMKSKEQNIDSVNLYTAGKNRIPASDDELMEIFERTYGKIKRDIPHSMHTEKDIHDKPKLIRSIPKGPEYLLVDGYNIIFAWDELNALARDNLDLARNTLINRLCSYQGYKKCRLILVFDAYKVAGQHREVQKISGITVVYTKEAETADMYIEKAAYELGGTYKVRVATSDGAEQIIIMGNNAYRVSAEEFHCEVKAAEHEMSEYINKSKGGNYVRTKRKKI